MIGWKTGLGKVGSKEKNYQLRNIIPLSFSLFYPLRLSSVFHHLFFIGIDYLMVKPHCYGTTQASVKSFIDSQDLCPWYVPWIIACAATSRQLFHLSRGYPEIVVWAISAFPPNDTFGLKIRWTWLCEMKTVLSTGSTAKVFFFIFLSALTPNSF